MNCFIRNLFINYNLYLFILDLYSNKTLIIYIKCSYHIEVHVEVYYKVEVQYLKFMI
jgi:hypothetical protein